MLDVIGSIIAKERREMIIRPVTDLRNRYPDVESDLKKTGELYLTKNGYGAAVLLSIEEYIALKGGNDLPAPKRTVPKKSARGMFEKYADPDLIPQEKSAGRRHVSERRSKYVPDASTLGSGGLEDE